MLSLLAGCAGDTKPTGPGPGPGHELEAERVRVIKNVPRFRLIDQAGEPFGRKDLEGDVWIGTFIFTRCTATCPAQTAEFARLQTELEDVRLVSITVDPAHDTPQVLDDYAARNGADAARWTFLTGEREDIWRLCKDGFNLPVSEDPEAIVTHSQNFVLVDRANRIRGFYDSQDERALGKLKRDIQKVRLDPPGPITERKEKPDNMTSPGPRLYEPREVEKTQWMKERAAAQAGTVGRFDVFHDFSFTDKLPASGIGFVSKVVDDAGKDWKGNHYDHGNGLAVADVDGDGRDDIYFVSQLGSNQLVRNLGDGKFEDVTASAGVAVADRVGVTASFADTDNDGDPDLYVTTVRGGNLLFENDGKGKFRDVSAASGLGYVGHSSSAVFFDYDRDGLLDLFLTNPGEYTTDQVGPGNYYVGHRDGFSGHLMPERTEQSILFHNEGGNRFVDVSKKTGLEDTSWTGAASPIDANDDGWPDLYVLSMQGHDEYYENQGGERFVKKSRELFPKTPWGSMGIKSFDFDNDGRMDIFITDMHTDMVDDALKLRRFWYAEKMKMTMLFPFRYLATDGNHVLGNAFFRNEGGGKFSEISDEIGAENYWPWGLSVGDLNADGYEDAFLTSCMNFPFRYGVNSLYLNNLGREFLDSEFILGVEPRRGQRYATPWFEIDCDGPDADNMLCKGRSGQFEVWAPLGTRSSAIFDLDADGDVDIVTNDFNSEPMLLISNLTEKKPDLHYLTVELVGTKANRDGLGARVRVKAGGQTYTKVHDGQSGYLSQSLIPLYFGLADATRVDEIEVTWPSATGTQVVKGPIEVNQRFVVTEP